MVKFALLLILVIGQFAQAIVVPFPIGPKGPHGGDLIRAVPKGPHTEDPGYYEKLYFEIGTNEGELIFQPFLVMPKDHTLVVPGIASRDLAQYRVDARFPQTKRDITLNSYLAKGAIRAVFGEDERRRLGMKMDDPFIATVTVVHEKMSKEAVFNVIPGEEPPAASPAPQAKKPR